MNNKKNLCPQGGDCQIEKNWVMENAGVEIPYHPSVHTHTGGLTDGHLKWEGLAEMSQHCSKSGRPTRGLLLEWHKRMGGKACMLLNFLSFSVIFL